MIPVFIKDVIPSAPLRPYVRKFEVFRFLFDPGITPPAKFYPPRPEHCITFYVNDLQKFNYPKSSIVVTYPRCVINGIYTIPLYRHGGNDFLAIKVVLQPSALYHLLRSPASVLTNQFLNAEEVWGARVRAVSERLVELENLSEMITAIEGFITSQIRIDIPPGRIDEVSQYLLTVSGNASIDWLARQACLSRRQFMRNFEERVGLSTKTFGRMIRFDRAYRMKNRVMSRDWPSIALACDYHDYQHLVRDFKDFTGLTPPAFYEIEMKSPERRLGLSYNIQ